MIKAIIFDFDGTLSNRNINAYYAYKDFFQTIIKDINEVELENIIQETMLYDRSGFSEYDDRINPIIQKYHLPQDTYDKLVDYWKKHMSDFSYKKEEVDEVLAELKKQYMIGILTNGDPYLQRNKLRHADVEKYADKIIVSGETNYHKPDKELFVLMAKEMGVETKECVYVGDLFPVDVIGSYRSGMKPVWVNDSYWNYNGNMVKKISNLKELFKVIDEYNK